MTYVDRYGLPLTTQTRAAVDAYVEGVDRLLSVQPGADGCLRRAIAEDPAFALAHIALARTLQLRMDVAEARASAAHGRTLLGGVTCSSRANVAAPPAEP